MVWKKRNFEAFDNEEHSIQFLKIFLGIYSTGYTSIDSLSFLNFIEWLGFG